MKPVGEKKPVDEVSRCFEWRRLQATDVADSTAVEGRRSFNPQGSSSRKVQEPKNRIPESQPIAVDSSEVIGSGAVRDWAFNTGA
jgi:hypothetical protein